MNSEQKLSEMESVLMEQITEIAELRGRIKALEARSLPLPPAPPNPAVAPPLPYPNVPGWRWEAPAWRWTPPVWWGGATFSDGGQR